MDQINDTVDGEDVANEFDVDVYDEEGEPDIKINFLPWN